MTPEQLELVGLSLQIEALIEKLESANKDGSPVRSRQLSLAITNLEQGNHWLADYFAEVT